MSLEATVTVPSSCTSILQVYSFWSARIVLPPEPMMSRIFSSGTVIVRRRGAKAESSGRAACERLLHLVEDEEAAAAGLLERLLEDLRRDAADLDVHLEGRDALRACRRP